MHFDKGKFGAVVIVVALILTIVLGFCSDVDKVEVERTDYDYITDITGLFETEQVPDYIEYNPNSNYVGYTGDIEYVTSNQPNNYRYVVADGATTTDYDTLGYNVIRPSPPGMELFTGVYLNYTGTAYSLTYQFTAPSGGSYNVYTFVNNSGVLNNASVTTLYDVIVESDLDYQGGETLEIDFSTSINYPVFALPSISNFTKTTGLVASWTATVTDDNVLDRVVLDVSTLYARAYKGATEVWSGLSTDIPVIYSYQANGYTGSSTEDNVPLVLTMDAMITAPPTYGYADPQGGVIVTDDTYASWENGYKIEKIRMLVGLDRSQGAVGDQTLYLTFRQKIGNSYAGAQVSISYLSNYLYIGNTNVGKWQGAIIDFNFRTGELIAIPTGSITSYTDLPDVWGDPIIVRAGGQDRALEETTISAIGNGSSLRTLRFGVYSTTVDLNSYNVVMNDPSIDIRDYWPNLDDYRLNFYSFALVGESITINGVEYPVGDGQTITVTESVAEGETAETYTQVLSNIYVSTDTVDGVRHTYLTFVDDRLTVDLGETVTEVVSFSGLWYFTTALYDAETVTYSEYEWNLDGKFGLSYDVVFLIFIVLCIAGIILGRVFLPDSMHFLDYVLIIGAIVIAYACMEVFL